MYSSEGRKEGVHHLLKEFLNTMTSFLACELRGDVELLQHSPFFCLFVGLALVTVGFLPGPPTQSTSKTKNTDCSGFRKDTREDEWGFPHATSQGGSCGTVWRAWRRCFGLCSPGRKFSTICRSSPRRSAQKTVDHAEECASLARVWRTRHSAARVGPGTTQVFARCCLVFHCFC